MKRILVAGIGNRIMGDDGFGPRVIELLSSMSLPENVDLEDLGTSGITSVMELRDHDLVIFLDSMKMDGEPGKLRQVEVSVKDLEEGDLDALAKLSIHEAGLEGLIKFAKAIGTLPPRVIIIGCKPKIVGLSLELSEEVERASHEAVDLVLNIIHRESN